MKRAALVLAGLAATTLAMPAGAAPAPPAPTARTSTHTVHLGLDSGPKACDAAPNSFDQPALTAAWSDVRPGRSATWTLTGTPTPVFTGCAEGVWTSAPLQLRKKGQVGTVAMSWSAVQLDPYTKGNIQTIAARFGDGRKTWGPWTNYFSGYVTLPLEPGVTHQAVVPITYRGTVPAKNVVLQVRVQDEFNAACAQIQHTVRVQV